MGYILTISRNGGCRTPGLDVNLFSENTINSNGIQRNGENLEQMSPKVCNKANLSFLQVLKCCMLHYGLD